MTTLLASINGPEDLKKLNASELPQLAQEIREHIRAFTDVTGGHIGSGMGVVELTVALHYLFEFREKDHLILDTGHQCYPHKILTGRRDQMVTIRQKNGLSGFPDPKESPYDRVKTGHGGTSLTTAVGMAVGLQEEGLNVEERPIVVAMIGDSALQEGSALEALNHGGAFKDLPLLIILNDNEMGISPAVGALSKYFGKVRTMRAIRRTSDQVERVVSKIESDTPRIGGFVRDVLDHARTAMHSFLPAVRPGTVFEDLGYFYYGPIDGHDLPTLLDAITRCRRLRRPVVLHCVTKKGMGYSDIDDRLCYHAGKPDKKVTANLPKEFSDEGGPAYTDIFLDEALKLAREDEDVYAITAAMLEGTGLVKFQEEFPKRCFDAGMAEQHAVGMAQGLALAGRKPICAIYSTFMQRAFDQIFQELALIKTPVMLCLDRAGVVGADGATHNGVFDIAYCRMLPDMVVMAPRDATELRAMMRMSHAYRGGPTAIRYPRTSTPLLERERPARAFGFGEAELLEDGRDGVLVAYGALVYPALDAARIIESRYGKRLAVVNGRFAKPLDNKMLEREFARQPVIFTLEDHVRAGGFGSAVLEHAQAKGFDTRKVEIIAIEDQWVDHGQRIEALQAAGIDVASIVRRIEKRLGLIEMATASSSQAVSS